MRRMLALQVSREHLEIFRYKDIMNSILNYKEISKSAIASVKKVILGHSIVQKMPSPPLSFTVLYTGMRKGTDHPSSEVRLSSFPTFPPFIPKEGTE